MVAALPILVRAALILVLLQSGATWRDIIERGDGAAFIRVALAIDDPVAALQLSLGGDSRAFPLWPMVLYPPIKLGAPVFLVVGLSSALAAAACVVLFVITRNLPAALLLAVAPPPWVLATLSPMSEGLFILLGLLAAWRVQQQAYVSAGVFAGLMIVAKPYGIAWVLAGFLILLAAQGDRLGRLSSYCFGVLAGGAPLVIFNLIVYGDIFQQVRVYGGSLAAINVSPTDLQAIGDATGHWGWPLQHLILTPLRVSTPLWKILYVAAHVVAVLALLPLAVLRFWRTRDEVQVLNFLGLAFAANAALALCAGPYWGFHSFDRYVSWAAPGAITLLAAAMPNRHWPKVAGFAGLVSLALTTYAVLR